MTLRFKVRPPLDAAGIIESFRLVATFLTRLCICKSTLHAKGD